MRGAGARRFSLSADVAPDRFGAAAFESGEAALEIAAELVARHLAELETRLGLSRNEAPRLGAARLRWTEPGGAFDHAVSYLKLRRAGRACFVVVTALYRESVLVATVRQCGAPVRRRRRRGG